MQRSSIFGFFFGLIIGSLFVYPFYLKSFSKLGNVESSIKNNVNQTKRVLSYEDSVIKTEREIIEEDINKFFSQSQGDFGLYIEYLNTGDKIMVNSQKQFYAASLYKLPVAISATKIYLENKTTLLKKLLKESDNEVQDKLLTLIPKDVIYEIFNEISGDTSFLTENISSPQEIALYLKELYNPTVISKNDSMFIINQLTNTNFEDRISLALAENIKFAHKIGNWPETGNWHDCGIVFTSDPYIICLMSENSTLSTVAEVAQKIIRYL